MKKIKYIVFFEAMFLIVFLGVPVFADPPASQTSGGMIKQEEDIQQRRQLDKRLEQPQQKPEEALTQEVVSEDAGPKVLINKINVEGYTLLTAEEVQKIVSEYEGKELSLDDMQKIADLITDEYRKKGYVTSRAYLPPQNIKGNTFTIRIIEGKLGQVQVQGNKYFKTSLLEKRIGLQSERYFDYSALQRSLVYVNEHPDRKARAVLVPGQKAGETDVVIDVKERNPFHVAYQFDNWGSRYIGHYRHSLVLRHNNLLGFDDKFYFQLQASDSYRLKVQQGRYLFPVTKRLEVGGYMAFSQLALGEEYKVLEARGKANIYGIFANQTLIKNEKGELRANVGFDYKSITNDLLGALSSRDELRVFKGGVDWDYVDRWGRTVVTPLLEVGVPGIMGGMAAKDPLCSRSNSGAEFYKESLNVFRLQPMPLSSTILWKNIAQYTTYNLPASEQFQIGGATSVRAYPPGEYSGDKGYYTALEWSFPFYFLNKQVKIPYYSQVTWYDALRWVVFYDWGTTHRNEPLSERKFDIIKGYGFGARLNILDNMECRVEVAYPDGKTPSDGNISHTWVEFTWMF